MGTNRCANKEAHGAFQGQLKAHQTPRKTKCFTHTRPLLQAICVSGCYMVKKKRKRFPGPPPVRPQLVMSPSIIHILRGRCANWQRQQVEFQGIAIGNQAMINVICMPCWQCNLVAATQQDTKHTQHTPRGFKAPASMCLYDTLLLTCSKPLALFAAMSSTFNFLFNVLFHTSLGHAGNIHLSDCIAWGGIFLRSDNLRVTCSDVRGIKGKTSMDRSTQATLSIYNTLIYVSHLQSIQHSTAGNKHQPFECNNACHCNRIWHHRITMKRSTNMSSKDSGLEAFSHNPTGCIIAAIIYQIAAFTKYLNEVFLSYWLRLLQ